MHPNTTRCAKTWVQGPMEWVGCIRSEKFQNDFMAQFCALIAPVQLFCTEFRVVMKYCQMHPNTTRRTRTWVYGPMGWIGSVHCKKFQCDFMARTCALIAPVHTILHRVSCSYETITNAPKHYETYENMSLGSNGVDWVRSLRKIPTWLRGTNFCINCTSSPRFAPSFMQLRNDPKCTQTLWKAPKHEVRVQWDGSGAFVGKNYNLTSWHELLH